MKKQLFALLMSLALLTGCGQTPTEEPHFDPIPGGGAGGDEPTEGGEIISHDSWDNVLSYDYSNLTIYSYDTFLDTPAYIQILDTGKYAYTYTIFDTRVTQYFADYEGQNYVYWDYTDEGGTTGYLNYNPEYEATLYLYKMDFYLPFLLSKITSNDVEYTSVYNGFYVKDSSLRRISEEVFGFAIDHSYFESIVILIEQDEEGKDRLYRMYCFDDVDDDNSPYLYFEFFNYGTTVDNDYPEAISASNIKDYWTITGRTEYEIIYPESLLITPRNPKVEEDYDIVLEVGESIEVELDILPEDYNRLGILSWKPNMSDFRDENGNLVDEYYDQVALFDFKSSYESGVRILTARQPGTVEVYVEHIAHYGDEPIQSNHLRVKVLPEAEIDETDAFYQFEFCSSNDEYNDPVWGSSSGYYQTRFEVINTLATPEYNPNYEITGFHAYTLPGRYTDNFDDVDQVLALAPLSGSVSEGPKSYIDIDTDDQLISSISFYYSLHRSGQLSYISNLGEAYIATSDDGVNFTIVKDMKEEMLNKFAQDSTMDMLAKLMEASFEPSNHIRIYISAQYYGQSFTMVFNDITLSHDEATHIDNPYTPVEGITLNASSNYVRVGQEITLISIINPSNATNKKCYYTSSNHNVATVTPQKDGSVIVKGLKEGTTTIKVYTDEKNNSGSAYYDEVVITVKENATLVEELHEVTYMHQEGTTTLSLTFDANNSSVSVYYYTNSKVYIDILTLNNELNGLYTFLSEESSLLIDIDTNNLSTIKINSSSVIKGITVPEITLYKVGQ